jgi:GNAT superfamily N-acetyltransferase
MTDALLATSRGTFEISTDPARLDVGVIHGYLSRSYWAADRPRSVVERSIAGSLVFGLFDPSGAQAGFARIVTDRATFAWLCDVFVLEDHRGLGLGTALVAAVLAHPDLEGVRMMLGTRDAHGLYARYGFEVVDIPDRFMYRPGVPAGPERPGDT